MQSVITLPKPVLPKPGGASTRPPTPGLASQLKRARMDSTHHAASLVSLLVSSGLCKLVLDEDFCVRSIRNGPDVIGSRETGMGVASLFNTPEADEHFGTLHNWLTRFRTPPNDADEPPWQQVFPSASGPSVELDRWIAYPDDAWRIIGNRARTQKTSKGIEFYLTSPIELVQPGDDFRIEYSARTDDEPHDLSIVVGGILDRAPTDTAFKSRPEDRGYCFAFGAMANSVTELQRLLLSVASTDEVRIIQGKNHVCEAERLGGLVRFTVDGHEAYRYSDPLPLFGRGCGHVSLYSYQKNHVFGDLKVFTRPTALSPKIRRLIPAMRRKVLPVRLPNGRRRWVEVCHMGSTTFIVKDLPAVPPAMRRK